MTTGKNTARNSTTAEIIPLKRFYVYALARADGEVFYVGRGTGGRMLTHMQHSHSRGVNAVLNEAVAGDERIRAEILSWHSSAAEAAKEEARAIFSYPQFQLVNCHIPAGAKGKGNISGETFTRWLVEMRREGIADTDAAAARLLGMSANAIVIMKRRGADQRTALACRALLHRMEPFAEGR
jgi:hypothetical protein